MNFDRSHLAPSAVPCARCRRAAHGTHEPISLDRLTCSTCGRPLLSAAVMREIRQLSDSDRSSLASALGEPLLAQLAELAHDLRVSTMGEMVAGLAHELNQPLYAVSNYARSCELLLRGHGELHAEFSQLADKLVAQADRAAEIVRRLRRFVSRREPRRALVDVNALVREVEHLMLFHANRFAIGIEVELAEHLPPVLGDSLLIEQVLVNLVRNAFEAQADAKSADPSVTMRTALADPHTIEVTVSDHGPGFGAARLEQLFEAFFTTKSSGMGLGLVISRSIVQAHGGALTASHRPQGGAVFRLTLPAYNETAPV
jgi:two-component system sensor kinase FixL